MIVRKRGELCSMSRSTTAADIDARSSGSRRSWRRYGMFGKTQVIEATSERVSASAERRYLISGDVRIFRLQIMQEVDVFASHGLRNVWQYLPARESRVFNLPVGNLSSYLMQPLDDPLREILPPRRIDHLEGFLVAMEVGHVAHHRSSRVILVSSSSSSFACANQAVQGLTLRSGYEIPQGDVEAGDRKNGDAIAAVPESMKRN